MQEFIQQPKELELSGSTTGRPEHSSPKEAEENDLKYNFMKMIETLKEEIKNS